MAPAGPDYRDFYDDDETCWQCDGEGGWNRCQEDCCPAIGGEESKVYRTRAKHLGATRPKRPWPSRKFREQWRA